MGLPDDDPNRCPSCGTNTGGGVCDDCKKSTDDLLNDLKK